MGECSTQNCSICYLNNTCSKNSKYNVSSIFPSNTDIDRLFNESNQNRDEVNLIAPEIMLSQLTYTSIIRCSGTSESILRKINDGRNLFLNGEDSSIV